MLEPEYMITLQVGDWVQATEAITEDNFNGAGVWTHSRAGGVGHVVNIEDGWPNVYFERTGTVTLCHPEQVRRLCNADASKLASPTL